MLRLLDLDGHLMPEQESGRWDKATVRALFRDLLLTRRLDEEAYHLQRQGELGLWLSCQGQEAAQVGSIRALRNEDYVFPSYREHGVGLCRGLSPAELLTQWRGTAHGGWDPSKYRLQVNTLVLGAQLLHATGYAHGINLDRKRHQTSDEIVACYVGDGATSEGDASEAFNWAAVAHAPILFFCQNNQWAISTPSSAQTKLPLHERAAGFGIRSTLVDGNDVLAVYQATSESAQRIRSGGGPEFIEAVTYRMQGHSTSDDPGRYRDSADLAEWQSRDPLTRVRLLLEDQNWADQDFFDAVNAAADELAIETRSACQALTPRELEEVFRSTYVEETPQLATERQAFTTWKESFA